MSTLCKYRHIFGKENEGVHSYRVFNLAIIDLLGTLILAIIFSKLFNNFTIKNIIIWFIALLIFSIIIHKIFCVDTTLTVFIFGKSNK